VTALLPTAEPGDVAAMRIKEAKAAGEEVPLWPVAQLKQSLIESQEKIARLERQVRDGGSRFDLHRDTVKGIADLIVRECTPSRVESLIRELRAAQKRRSAHAGVNEPWPTRRTPTRGASVHCATPAAEELGELHGPDRKRNDCRRHPCAATARPGFGRQDRAPAISS
jgi:hypothetical protein